MAKLHHTEYKRNYKNFVLECIENEDDLIGKNLSDDEKINYLFNRFYSEYGFFIERQGKHSAMTDWLSGLAIDIPYYHFDIIELAKKMGSIDENSNDAVEDKVIENYFSFMANVILSFEPKEVA